VYRRRYDERIYMSSQYTCWLNHLLVPALTLVAGLSSSAMAQPLPRVQQLSTEFSNSLKQRQMEPKFDEMKAFFAERLDNSAHNKTFSDKTGNCRLSFFDFIMRRPERAAEIADEFTRQVHSTAKRAGAIPDLLNIAAAKLDAPLPSLQIAGPHKPLSDRGLDKLRQTVGLAQRQYARALTTLTEAELSELRSTLYVQTTGPKARAPFFSDRYDGRCTSDLFEKIDRKWMLQAATTIATLGEAVPLQLLSKSALARSRSKSPAVDNFREGNILFGGPGKDTYRLDQMDDVCAIIDAGGDDTYIEGALSAKRPMLVIIDFGGNDTYRGQQPGIQGGAILGVSALFDMAGNDTYSAGDVAQGSALGGVGILHDIAGNDRYLADKRVQGQAVCGVGLLIDRAGDDDYRAALLGQGVGGPLGFGLLDDLAGTDHYYAGGKYADPYDDSPGYNGWSQGVGVGPRGVANGGIGMLLDGGGDDVYEADYFSYGGGYWFALGFARDFGGNDQRVGSTRTLWDGSERKEPRFMRYGNGFGVHYAAGFIFDDSGNDLYFTDFAGTGFNWDLGITVLVDLAGNDRYEAGSGVGPSYNAGLNQFLDVSGDDTYVSGNAGNGSERSEYHEDPRAHNFTFMLDLKGNDTWPEGVANKQDTLRGWAGAVISDR